MKDIKLNIINETDGYPEKPGDAFEYKDSNNIIKLCWCCPKCGKPTATANGHNHDWDPKTKSLTPSIVHDVELGGCGYHGFLTNGVFKSC